MSSRLPFPRRPRLDKRRQGRKTGRMTPSPPLSALPPRGLFAAALWMCGAIASFSAMAVSARMIGDRHDTFEILAYRSLLGVALVLAVVATTGQTARLGTRRLGAHAFRNTVHFTGQALWFFAIASIPLAQVIAIEFTSPLWVVLAAPFFLGERLTPAKVLAAILGLAGVLVVARPDFGRVEPGLLAAAGAALFFAATTVITKRLTRGEDIVAILFWLVSFQAGFGLVLAAADGAMRPPDAGTLPWLGVIGLSGLGAHFSLTRALSLAPASQVVPFDFARLPLLAVVGALVFDEPLTLGLAVGAGLILVANWISLRGAMQAGLPQSTPHDSVTPRR